MTIFEKFFPEEKKKKTRTGKEKKGGQNTESANRPTDSNSRGEVLINFCFNLLMNSDSINYKSPPFLSKILKEFQSIGWFDCKQYSIKLLGRHEV